MTERRFIEEIENAGGTVYLVGGYVRDRHLGRIPKDRDYVITNMEEAAFCRLFSSAKKVGKGFPVYHLRIDGSCREVAFARKERKAGHGYRGFVVEYSPQTTIEEDLARRDTTMNSVALRLCDHVIIDPFGGVRDMECGIIRATSEHFAEDPVRALRAARQAAELGFTVDVRTMEAMRRLREELAKEPQERVLEELKKALSAPMPATFFRVLLEARLLDVVFPELYVLHGTPEILQYHPEGDSFLHTMHVLDAVAKRTENILARFSALVHDLGKGSTPKEILPHHYGHDIRGADLLRAWNARQTLPRTWLRAGDLVIREHMRAGQLEKVGKIVDLYTKIAVNPLPFQAFTDIVAVDQHKLPYYLEDDRLYAAVMDVHADDRPAHMEGADIGIWLRNKRIKVFRQIAAAYQA